MDTLYEYTLDWSKGSKRHHLDGERIFVERYVRLDEFDALFGGKMLLVDPGTKSEFVGVWGASGYKPFQEGSQGSRCRVHHPASGRR